MYYVAKNRIYGTHYDSVLKGYPEFKIAEGKVVATGKVVAMKPKNRQLCEEFEVLAQLSSIFSEKPEV